MTTTAQNLDHLSYYPEAFRPFANRLLDAMQDALDSDNKREHGQICKVLNCLKDASEPAVYPFWTQRAKALAAEWQELREQAANPDIKAGDGSLETGAETCEPASLQPTDSSLRPSPKPRYRQMTYEHGVNPFRAGTKNAKVYDLLRADGGTKEELAEASGADPKSVGYCIWLLQRNEFPVKKDAATKSYRLIESTSAENA